MVVEVAEPLSQKKDNPSQEVLGAPAPPPRGLDEAIQQTSSVVALKEFQKQGVKKLKVISQKGLEELIHRAVEWELARRLDKERETRMALEEEVSGLKRELETLRRVGVKTTAIGNERLDAGSRQPEGHDQITEGQEPSSTSGKATPLSPGSSKANIVPGGFFGKILKENLNLRGVNQKTSDV